MKVTLTRITDNPILAIEEAASNCYDSEPSSEGKIMDACIKSGHTSVTEFCTYTFHIEGVSRALLAQLTRHRHAGFAVQSQRYVKKNVPTYITPPSISKIPEAQAEYDKIMEYIWSNYNKFVSLGIPPEDARYMLPNACDTVIEITINHRALMNFMNERLCTRAQWEIRHLAIQMKKCVEEVNTKLAESLVPKCEKHKGLPFCPEFKSCGRHPKLSEVYNNHKCEVCDNA